MLDDIVDIVAEGKGLKLYNYPLTQHAPLVNGLLVSELKKFVTWQYYMMYSSFICGPQAQLQIQWGTLPYSHWIFMIPFSWSFFDSIWNLFWWGKDIAQVVQLFVYHYSNIQNSLLWISGMLFSRMLFSCSLTSCVAILSIISRRVPRERFNL